MLRARDHQSPSLCGSSGASLVWENWTCSEDNKLLSQLRGGVNKQSTAEMDTRLMQLSARSRYLCGTSLLEPALSIISCSSPRSLPHPRCMTASVWLLLDTPLMMGASSNAPDYSIAIFWCLILASQVTAQQLRCVKYSAWRLDSGR